MLKKLFNGNWFNYKDFIFDNQKILSVNPIEAQILIYLLDSYNESDDFCKEKLMEKINVSKDTFEASLSSLLSKELFEIYLNDRGSKSYEAYNMDGFFNKCEAILNGTLVFDEDELYSIMKIVSKTLNKVLSSNEIDIIKSLYLEDRYTIDDFKLASNNLDKKRVKNIKSLTLELENLRRIPKNNEQPEFLKKFLNDVK